MRSYTKPDIGYYFTQNLLNLVKNYIMLYRLVNERIPLTSNLNIGSSLEDADTCMKELWDNP
jgi:hypothetical protein